MEIDQPHHDEPSRSRKLNRLRTGHLRRGRFLLLFLALLMALGAGWASGFGPDSVLGFSRPVRSYISPDGKINSDHAKLTSFGDADDLQELGPVPVALAAGTLTVSGHVTDATTGAPVANANVGISLGAVGSAANYTTTATDGSYTFASLASGTYNLASSRYTISGTQPLYAYATQMSVAVNGSVTVNFSLKSLPVPGVRPNPCNRAKNIILIDYDETYYESFFTDANSMKNKTPALHAIANAGVNATENWTSYGWSPIDHYQIAVGSYPAWRTPDAPAAVWGQPDGLDTNIWYGGSEHFLQESVFDVAKSYGMSTAVIGGNDYPTGHITDANVDLIQLAANPSGTPTIWATEVENFITAHASNPNGFFIYLPATMAEGRTVESTSPDAAGSAYQVAVGQDDQTIQTLESWLQTNGYMSNTVLAGTADEAENDHTSFDNFYGNGTTGGGTTRHVPFVMSGPGIIAGPTTYTTVMNMDDESANLLNAVNLPANVDSRGHVIPSFFQPLSCGGGTPTATPTTASTLVPTATNTPPAVATNTPTRTTTATSTSPAGATNTPTRTATATTTPTHAPTATNTTGVPTNTPTPGNSQQLIVNGGFESGSTPWVEASSGGYEIVDTVQPHTGTHSADLCGYNSCSDTIYQTITIPATASTASLNYYTYITTQETSHPYDFLNVQVQSTGGTVLGTLQQLSDGSPTGSWKQSTYDVSSYKGQTVRIVFAATNDSSNSTDFFVDDVSLNVNGGSGATATPTRTATKTPTTLASSTPTTVLPPTATPTSLPATATSTPGAGSQLIVNGGFESGTSPWVVSSSGGYGIVSTTRPHTGTYSAYLCGYNNCSDTLYQTVSIPANITSASLSYWWYMSTHETQHPYDFMHARVRSTSGTTLTTLQTLNDGSSANGWFQASYDLSAYKGQTVQIAFVSTNDTYNTTSFFIDDVALNTH
ncbi:MAG: immune inhibitor A [Herpetosiphonaceae bacterium]|nr:immune inhibitor A [Herpetosiphonaceae bacterium]